MEFKKYVDEISNLNNYTSISVITSRDCSLRCSYCYLHKSPDNDYDINKVLNSLDELLDYYHNNSNHSYRAKNGIILEFYPEPWVNIKRTNKLIEESLKLLYKYPRFYDKWVISLGTNGLLLEKKIPIVEKINKIGKVSVSVTVDGIKEQHDLYRVKADGSGSWDKIVSNVRKYQKKFNIYGTKVTIGPDTLKYIFESTKYLWNELNLNTVNMNVVFEDVWGSEKEKQISLEIYEEQLILLTDYIIKYKLWEQNKYVSVVGDRHIPQYKTNSIVLGDKQNSSNLYSKKINIQNAFTNKPYCGAAVMRSIDVDGQIYPCFRLSPYSLNEPSPYNINKHHFVEGPLRALHSINALDNSNYECLSCDLLSSCHMCYGGSWEETKSVYYRTTHHCEFQKLQYKYAVKLKREINRELVNKINKELT